jgi:hypothetical protein
MISAAKTALVIVLLVGCSKGGSAPPLEWKPIGKLGVEASLAANDTISESVPEVAMISVADRSGRRGAGSSSLYVKVRGGMTPDSLDTAKARYQKDLDRGKTTPSPAEWSVATQTGDAWHLEWKETGTETPLRGVSIGATVGDKKLECTGSATYADDLKVLVSICESLRAKP